MTHINLRSAAIAVALSAGFASTCWGDAAITLSGSYSANVERTFSTDTTVNLNGVNFTDCTLKFASANEAAPVTVTLNLVDGTQNVFNMIEQNKELIKATKKTNIIINGTGSMTLTSQKRITDGTDATTGEKIPSGILVCNNLTVTGGDTKIVYDTDKPDTYCALVKGNYLQTGGKLKLDVSKKNKDTKFVGMKLDSKNTTFTLEGGKFNAEVAGTDSRAIDLKGSCTATFTDGEVKCEFEGPGTRFIDGGTIVFNGGSYNFITNITSKMTSAYYPTGLAAVKTDKSITINGGDFEADLPLVDSEVFKTVAPDDPAAPVPPINITGGDLDLIAGNDCISAKGDITISGGHIRCTSVFDDALDANGSLTISGGDIRAYATCADTHGLDVNKGNNGVGKKTLTITGGIVIATDGPDTVKIGTPGSDEVGNVNFTQATYYGTVNVADYAGKYLTLEGVVDSAPVTIKPRLPDNFQTGGATTFNLLVSVPGRTASVPEPKTAAQAYADGSSHKPLAFERKAEISDHTITTKFGEVITIPAYYDLTPASGKTKTVELVLNANAAPTITSMTLNGLNFDIGLVTLAGLKYRVIKADSPTAPAGDWSVTGVETAGDGAAKTIAAPKDGNAKFYRVRVSD